MEFHKSLYPKKPGVYLMHDAAGKVIYVGKAKNLATRLSQYFIPGRDSRLQIPLLVAKVNSIKTIVVTSEKEALLLEYTLIKKHKPRYNFLLKDDKSYICLEITDHKWPALKWIRQKDVKKKSNIFGPYVSAYAARRMLYLLQRIFPLRECSDFVLNNRTRPCILYQMKRCIAPCVNKCSQEEYQSYVDEVIQFLKGQNQMVLNSLKDKMKEASKNMEYEKAGNLLETIRHIESLLEKQLVIGHHSINCEVLGIYRQGEMTQLSLLSFEQGQLLDTQTFALENKLEEDPELISSFLTQNYLGKKNLPHEILLPTKPESHEILQQLLSQEAGYSVQIHVPQKGDKKKLILMAKENAQTSFFQKQREVKSKEELLIQLKNELKLENYPDVIECFDNSHLSGSKPVAAMVTFVGGHYDKSRLRKYHLNPDQVFDDLKGMEEVLLRRYRNEELPLPDLILIDGGKTQLKVAQDVLAKLEIIHVDLVAITKEKGRHDFGTSQEKLIIVDQPDPIILPKHSNLLFFLQNIRDQTHKAAIEFQRKSRKKGTFKSILDNIPGIGPKKKKALIEHFKSPKKVQEASLEDLKQVKSLNKRDLENLEQFLLNKKA